MELRFSSLARPLDRELFRLCCLCLVGLMSQEAKAGWQALMLGGLAYSVGLLKDSSSDECWYGDTCIDSDLCITIYNI
jgi:hypothetical protein